MTDFVASLARLNSSLMRLSDATMVCDNGSVPVLHTSIDESEPTGHAFRLWRAEAPSESLTALELKRGDRVEIGSFGWEITDLDSSEGWSVLTLRKTHVL